jgi:hypothetical protein
VDGTVRAEGDLDFRGTLGVDRTEGYCVVFQTIHSRPAMSVGMNLS